MNNSEAKALIIEAAKIVGFSIVDKTHGENYHPWLEITTKNGNVISIGRAHNKDTHWGAFAKAFTDSQNQSCAPYNSSTPSANIKKDNTPEKFAKWLTKIENDWCEWFTESKEIQTRKNTYHNTITNHKNKILAYDFTKDNGNKDNNVSIYQSEKEIYGKIYVCDNYANIELSSVDYETLTKILDLLK